MAMELGIHTSADILWGVLRQNDETFGEAWFNSFFSIEVRRPVV